MLGTDSTTLFGVFEADLVGSTGDTLVGVFGGFGGSTGDIVGVFSELSGTAGDTLVGFFGPEEPEEEPHPGDGGVGHSWFVVELTSEHVYEAGEGGVGQSWFTVELTSQYVEPPEEPPIVSTGGPSTAPRQKRRERIEERFSGKYNVIESIEQRHRGRFYINTPQRFAASYQVVETTTQAFSATYALSSLRFTRRREEEELVLMMADE